MFDLQTPVQYLKGIGPRRAEDLATRNLQVVEDLLYNLPYRYEDRTHFKKVKEIIPGERATILVEVLTSGLIVTRKSRLRIFDLAARDSSGLVRGKWFHSDYLDRRKVFKPGQKVILYGKFEVDPYGTGNLQVINPEFEILDAQVSEDPSGDMGRIVPIYEAIKGCSSRMLRRILYGVVTQLGQIEDPMPRSILQGYRFPDRKTALAEAHFPPAGVPLEQLQHFRHRSQERLIFEELFFLELGLALKRRKAKTLPGFAFQINSSVREALKKMLPFHPTAAQKRVLKEIADDLCRPAPMNRLLQGDVGCGKTIVALEAASIAVENNYQVGLMAPTEILAEQHAFNARRIFVKTGYRVGLLKSGMKKGERRGLLEKLANGEIQMLIGTHAILERDVEFKNLGLVIIDEQHRFGVMQRFDFMKKSATPHTLVMTATPIPRTLALTLYGDLDVSVIDELPPHRSPIATRRVQDQDREKAYRLIRDELKQGRQAYVVCPIIEESEKVDLKAAQETFEHMKRDLFPQWQVDLLHGRLKSEEKEQAMKSFQSGKTQILVATTVVEVGVDVPNATVMLIEHAERFGLAQLHQLRGRIGRGSSRSHCLLCHGKDLTEEAEARLQCMVEQSDGFKIAEKDLEIRGPGEFFGTKQSGMPMLRIANLIRDREYLELARREAMQQVEHPSSEEDWKVLIAYLKVHWQRRYGLVSVG
ncbi:MAG: ATP-dependent DNA helicase RecG [Terriglobia bacterium]